MLKIDSPFEQWYHRRLEPGKHFLRLAADLSNFQEVYAWLSANDAEAQRISEAGDCFVRSLLLEQALNELAFCCQSVLAAQRHAGS